jgi:hypothetical protein
MKRLRRVLIVLSAIVLTLVVGLGCFYLGLTTEGGREWLARKIEDVYAEQVTGTLEIGHIRRLSGLAVDANDVRFLDPRARETITIADVHLEIELRALLGGKLLFSNGRARGGRVVIVPGRTFSTTLEDAFGSRGARGGEPLDIDTGVIEIERTVLVVAMGGPRVRLGGINGALRVWRRDAEPVRVELERLAGSLSLPGFEALEARRFTAGGLVHAEHTPLLDLRIRACLARGEIPARLRFSPGRLHLRFDPSDNRLAGMVLGATGLSPTIETERGAVNVRGIRRC